MPTPRKSLDVHALQSTKPKYVEPNSDCAAGRPKIPKGVNRKTFKRVVAMLEHRQQSTPGDGEIIRVLCIALERHQRALAHLEIEGEVAPYERLDSNGQAHTFYKENLWLKIATDSEKLQIACLDRLGLTPLNRGKIKPARDPKAPQPLTFEEEALLSREAPQPALDDEPNLEEINTTVN